MVLIFALHINRDGQIKLLIYYDKQVMLKNIIRA